jgi:hypothetical protein
VEASQTPIKEPAMATIHLHETTTDGYLKVHDQGPAQAEAPNYRGQAQS